MDEISVIKEMHQSQKRWRRMAQLIFITIAVLFSVIFIVMGRNISGAVTQILMIISMLSIGGLVFLDVVSFLLNKKFFRKDILGEYLFKHSKPEDMHKAEDIVVELIKDRREACQEQKRM